MNIKEIEAAIISGDFNASDLSLITNALNVARAILAQKTKGALRIGDVVSFKNPRLGGAITSGIVEKVAVKFVNVRSESMLWKVPASMLTKVEASA
jgi:hypothetical protein